MVLGDSTFRGESFVEDALGELDTKNRGDIRPVRMSDGETVHPICC